jgi:hypothetical protein
VAAAITMPFAFHLGCRSTPTTRGEAFNYLQIEKTRKKLIVETVQFFYTTAINTQSALSRVIFYLIF